MDPDFLLTIVSGLVTLTMLELVLGIDNIIFLSIVSSRLPAHQQPRARQVGLGMAVGLRILMLLGIAWLMGLSKPVFSLFDLAISWRDIILLGGGLFLIAKASTEIHHEVDLPEEEKKGKKTAGFAAVVGQIVLLDVVFSLDSILTAVGMVEQIWVMILAILIAVAIMIWSAEPVSAFVNANPSVKMLGLSFLLMIGVALIADGFHFHIPRGYMYAAVGFAALVEMLNLMRRRRRLRLAAQVAGGSNRG